MGEINSHDRVLLVVAAFSRYGEALDWARQQIIDHWGPLAVESPRFAFTETKFYEPTMGGDLLKTFVACQQLIEPDELVEIKHRANELEDQYCDTANYAELRPLNLDPGYLTEAKFVLATTKDRDHRLYLRRGIFAEVTLSFHHGKWQARPWTYPDYCRSEYHEFLVQCRDYFRAQRRKCKE